ncbi:hypothetical protein LTR66_001700 [Elasticomyces elasticus]|nr:hypothetical protein LTR66_001700 [Elasticomyces elasticus]
MTTAVATTPVASAVTPTIERNPSPRQYPTLAPLSAPPTRSSMNPTSSNASPTAEGAATTPSLPSDETVSPTSSRVPPPMITVKKEPASPNPPTSRPRPRRLDLSSSSMPSSRGPQTARPSAPLTSKESAGLAIQDVGLACLSPGFQTHDPAMREQLQRSLDVRDQQRQIIEARQKGSGKPSSSHESGSEGARDTTLFGVPTKTPTTSRRKGPPPGLSITAPSAQQFASERVIQSAPLHQSFTGLRPQQPYTRHMANQPSGLSQTSHIHHVPATQTNNRLPPIADVFASDNLAPAPQRDHASRNATYNHSPAQSSYATYPPPLPSPSFPRPAQSTSHAPLSARPREYRSAEEAVVQMSGGREDLLPKIVHYGGVQPPTPPSPMPPQNQSAQSQQSQIANGQSVPSMHPDLYRTSSVNGRRRGRDEYERDNGSPTFGQEARSMPFSGSGLDRDREDEAEWRPSMNDREKKEEFLKLCERAWDLLHS